MNLFLAVLADNFAVADESDKKSEDDDEKDDELEVAQAAAQLQHDNPFRQKCLNICTSKYFDKAMTGFILLNTVIMCIDFYPRNPTLYGDDLSLTKFKPPAYFWTLWSLNATLTLIFTVESFIKILGLGLEIFVKDRFNLFDVLVVFISLVEVVLDILTQCRLIDVGLPGLSALRALRVFRVLKLVRSVETLRTIFATLSNSIASVTYLGMLLFLFIFIFALLGMEFFGGFTPVPHMWKGHGGQYNVENFPCAFEYYHITWSSDDDSPRCNFDTFFNSFVSIFIVLSGENWNEIYFDMHRATWHHSSVIATGYFLLLFVVGNLLLFNLFIAILISNMEGDDEDDEDIDEDPKKVDCDMLVYDFGLYKDQDGKRGSEASKGEKSTSTISRSETSIGSSKKTGKSTGAAFLEDVEGSTDKALMLFSWKNPLRRACAKIILHQLFDQVVVVLILISSVMLGLDWPSYPSDSVYTQVIQPIDVIFTVLFSVEMLLKIIVMGFIFSKDKTRPAYLRISWNVLDFFVVCVSIINLIANNVGGLNAVGPLRAIRALRALRPLRLVARMENMRIVVSTLLGAVPAVGTFGVFMLLFVIIFAILFMQMFGGRLGYCLDPHFEDEPYGSRVIPGVNGTYANDYLECMALPKYNISRHDSFGNSFTSPVFADKNSDFYYSPEGYREFAEFPKWVNPDFGNFDNIATSVLLLMEVAFLEGWPDVMFMVMDSDIANEYIVPWWLDTSVDPDGLFGHDHQTSTYLGMVTFVLWIILGCFVLLNMVIGVVLDSFNKIKEENDGLTMMTEEQGEWVRAQKQIVAMRPLKQPTMPKGAAWRLAFFKLVTSNAFDLLIMMIIMINMLFMCITVWNPSPYNTDIKALADLNKVVNIIFFVLYVVEMLLKWTGLGLQQYFKDVWNQFDFFLVLVSAFDLYASTAPGAEGLPFPPSVLRVVRLFRVVRILRILKTAKNLRTIITTIRVSLPGLYNITILLSIVLYIYAVICMNFFYRINYTPGVIYPYGGGDKAWFTQGITPECSNPEEFKDGCPMRLQTVWVGDYYYTNGNSNDGDFINRHANFRNLGFSVLTLIRCATGESFNGIMHDMMGYRWGTNRLRCCPSCGPIEGGKPTSSCDPTGLAGTGDFSEALPSLFLMLTYTVVMGFIILNGLFIGVIVDNFTNIGSEGKTITVEAIEEFREVWLRFDPKGTFAIQSHSLLSLLQHLSRPLGIADEHPALTRMEMLLLLGTLNIPDHAGKIHFSEVLTALAHRVCGAPLPLCDTTKSIQKQVAKVPGLKHLESPVHNALTNYLASLMQSRWRGYAMRKKAADDYPSQVAATLPPLPTKGLPPLRPEPPSTCENSKVGDTNEQGKVKATQVLPQ